MPPGSGTSGDEVPVGVRVVDLVSRDDDRGSFTELFRQDAFPDARQMVQANLSVNRAGVLRGLHFHRDQTDYWCVLEGVAFVALLDVRRGSPSYGQPWWHTFDAGAGLHGILIPPGVAHGFCAVTAMKLHYLVDRPFTGKDEFGVAWDDPALAIPWPAGDPVTSERDRSNARLAEVTDAPAFAP